MRSAVRAQSAGAYTTSVVLAALPLLGLGIGAGMGADPLRELLFTRLGAVCAIGAVLFQCAGIAWTSRLIRGAVGGVDAGPVAVGGESRRERPRPARVPNAGRRSADRTVDDSAQLAPARAEPSPEQTSSRRGVDPAAPRVRGSARGSWPANGAAAGRTRRGAGR
jgi:hypothetical protein